MKQILFIIAVFGLFSCTDKRKEMLKDYFQKANEVCKGDTTGVQILHEELSINAKKQIDKIPGYLVYLLAKTTRKGTIEKIEVMETNQKTLRFVSQYAAIYKVRLTYLDSSNTTFEQKIIYENGVWKIGL